MYDLLTQSGLTKGLCVLLSVHCTPDPQKVIGIIENVSFKALNFMIFVKNSRGGREVNMINNVSKILSKIGWEGGGSPK